MYSDFAPEKFLGCHVPREQNVATVQSSGRHRLCLSARCEAMARPKKSGSRAGAGPRSRDTQEVPMDDVERFNAARDEILLDPEQDAGDADEEDFGCLLYTSPSPRDRG